MKKRPQFWLTAKGRGFSPVFIQIETFEKGVRAVNRKDYSSAVLYADWDGLILPVIIKKRGRLYAPKYNALRTAAKAGWNPDALGKRFSLRRRIK